MLFAISVLPSPSYSLMFNTTTIPESTSSNALILELKLLDLIFVLEGLTDHGLSFIYKRMAQKIQK